MSNLEHRVKRLEAAIGASDTPSWAAYWAARKRQDARTKLEICRRLCQVIQERRYDCNWDKIAETLLGGGWEGLERRELDIYLCWLAKRQEGNIEEYLARIQHNIEAISPLLSGDSSELQQRDEAVIKRWNQPRGLGYDEAGDYVDESRVRLIEKSVRRHTILTCGPPDTGA